MRKDMLNDAPKMLEATGVKNVKGRNGDGTLGRGIHEMGSARMGKDSKTSVLNSYNQMWDAPNVFNRRFVYDFCRLRKSISYLYGLYGKSG